MMKRIFSAFYLLIFGAFAYLQVNDPDPLMWVAIYGIVAIAAGLNLFIPIERKTFIYIALALVLVALFYMPGFVEYLIQPNKGEIVGEMVYEKPYIEETREFIGLMMAAGAMWHLYKLK